MQRRTFLSLPALPLPAAEGWSWERWRTISGEGRPAISTEQTGRADLCGLLGRQGRTFASPAAWAGQRAQIAQVLEVFLGRPPSARPPLEAKVSGETRCEGYRRHTLTFQTEPGEFVPGFLLTPDQLRGRAPAVICPHQTTQEGKKEPAGLAGNPRLHIAHRLAQRGYVTFTYDAACFGERHDPATNHYGDAIPFYRRHPHWSMMGKMVWDLSRAIDYLETLPFVDGARIASIGHSHGGYTTLFAMALDERIRVGVSSCGFDTFRYDGNPYRWSHATALLPRLGFYITSPYIGPRFYAGVPDSETIQIPFDMHHVLALAAPRPLLLSTSDEDAVFPNAGWSARQALARLAPLYAMLGCEDRLASFFFRGGHGFPPEAERIAFEWLDRWLRG